MIKSSSQRTKSSLKTGNQGQTTRLLTSRANFVCFRRILAGYLSNRLQYKFWFQGFENTTVLKFPHYSAHVHDSEADLVLQSSYGGTDTAEMNHYLFISFFHQPENIQGQKSGRRHSLSYILCKQHPIVSRYLYYIENPPTLSSSTISSPFHRPNKWSI